MIRILHAADFHLDTPFSWCAPEQAAQLREEQREMVGRIADLALAREVDMVLLPGDLFDADEHPRYETLRALTAALKRMEVPVFIAPGNHDLCAGRSVYTACPWPENVHIFAEETVTSVPLPALGCTVYGAAFTPTRLRAPLEDFKAPQDGGVHIMALHADITGMMKPDTNLTVEMIAASGLQYLALGHIHTCSGLHRDGATYWAYPGCPAGRGFDETGEKGVLLVSVAEEETTAEFVPIGARRFEIVERDVTGWEDIGQVLPDTLPQGAARDFYRVILCGEAEHVDAAALERRLAPRFYAVSVVDHTLPPRDIWARLGEDTLTGTILRRMRARGEAGEDVSLAVRFGLAALERGEDCRI
ncbi:MAG: DNA repair exonuclease [Oscillospiraceae bacterium]|nr:DNA repair exonuclease [Oscillospiraceae bacterium]